MKKNDHWPEDYDPDDKPRTSSRRSSLSKRTSGRSDLNSSPVTAQSSTTSTSKKSVTHNLDFMVTGKQILRRCDRTNSLPSSYQRRPSVNSSRIKKTTDSPILSQISSQGSEDDMTLDLSQISDSEESSKYGIKDKFNAIATSTPKRKVTPKSNNSQGHQIVRKDLKKSQTIDLVKVQKKIASGRTQGSVDLVKAQKTIKCGNTQNLTDLSNTQGFTNLARTHNSFDSARTQNSVDSGKSHKSVNFERTHDLHDSPKAYGFVESARALSYLDQGKSQESKNSTKVQEFADSVKAQNSLDSARTQSSVDSKESREGVISRTTFRTSSGSLRYSGDLDYSSISTECSGQSSVDQSPRVSGQGDLSSTAQLSSCCVSTWQDSSEEHTKIEGGGMETGEWNSFWANYNNSISKVPLKYYYQQCPTPYRTEDIDLADFELSPTESILNSPDNKNLNYIIRTEGLHLTPKETQNMIKCAHILGNVLTKAIERRSREKKIQESTRENEREIRKKTMTLDLKETFIPQVKEEKKEVMTQTDISLPNTKSAPKIFENILRQLSKTPLEDGLSDKEDVKESTKDNEESSQKK